MPCASNPPTNPHSTSPLPAVPSQGVPLALMAARPSGAAITVSAPFSTTTASRKAAAARARARREPSAGTAATPLNRRANSPSCGVATAWDPPAAIISTSSSARPEKLVRASASRTRPRPASQATRTRSRVGAPLPRPGPATMALRRSSVRVSSRSSAPSQGRSMIAVIWAAFSASAGLGDRSVTRPAPIRRAPRAASRAAPVRWAGPDSTTAWPRVYLWLSALKRGKAAPHRSGPLSWACAPIPVTTASGMPISATVTGPHRRRPGSSRWPGFGRAKVTVSVAVTTGPRGAPVSPSRPEGTSTASTGTPEALMRPTRAAAAPSSGRERPAPNRASTTSAKPAGSAPAASATGPVHSAAAAAASPRSAARSPRSATSTAIPAAARRRAATNPSPPLLPGPHRTRTRPSPALAPAIASTRSATAAPARRIRSRPGVPAAIAAASARRISSVVSNSVPAIASYSEERPRGPALPRHPAWERRIAQQTRSNCLRIGHSRSAPGKSPVAVGAARC